MARKAARYLTAQRAADGTWRYYWTPPSKLRALTDRPHWIRSTPLGADPNQALRDAEALNTRLDAWRAGQTPATGIGAMIDAYRGHSAYRRLKPRTKLDYDSHLDSIRAVMGGDQPSAVTAAVVDVYREALLSAGVPLRTVEYRMQVLRLLLRWARKTGRYPDAVPIVGTGVRPKRRKPTPWQLADLRAIVARNPYPIGLAVRLGLYLMQREGDVLAAGWDDLRDGRLHVVQGKGDAELWLPVHPWLEAALDAAPRRGRTILATREGAPYTLSGFRAMWRLARDAAVPEERRRRYHDVRGTGISLLRAGRLPDEDVMLWSGHKRSGEGAVLDFYDARIGDMAARAWPVMDGWEV